MKYTIIAFIHIDCWSTDVLFKSTSMASLLRICNCATDSYLHYHNITIFNFVDIMVSKSYSESKVSIIRLNFKITSPISEYKNLSHL